MRKIIINSRTIEKQAAVFEKGKLVELLLEANGSDSIVGNIYKGRIEKVESGLQAAFVNIGHGKNGFLQIEQLAAYKYLQQSEKERISISNLLHQGQEIIVQVSKDGFGEKGPRLTTLLELPGQFVVYMPNEKQIAVSKKMEEKEREYWRSFGQSICNDNEGVLFRTVCKDAEQDIVRDEIEFLKRKWSELAINHTANKPPCLLFNNSSLEERLLRDVIGEQPTEIIVDNGESFRKLKEQIGIYAFTSTSVTHYMNREDIFSHFEVEQEIEQLLKPYVRLENGASLMIEQTEALTVIDVNTDKFTGKYNARETVVKTNKLAATEIARQLRLRNIGGIILIDFINMDQEKDREIVKKTLIEALKTDRNYTRVFGFTQLGLLEMTRKKERKSLLERITTICPTCNELGRVISSEQLAFRIERTLREYKGADQEAIWIEAPEEVVGGFKKDNHLQSLENALGFTIFMSSSQLLIDSFSIRHIGSENEIRARVFKSEIH